MDSIKIPADALNGLVARAIFDSIGPEQRDALITSAITKLIEPRKDSYGRTEASPLQEAFERAIGVATNRVVNEVLESDEQLKSKLREVVSDKLRDLLDDNYSLQRVVSEALADAILRKEY